MFTGIITNTGSIASVKGANLTIQTDDELCRKIEIGTSIAVNGVCLTAVSRTDKSFSVTLMPETLKKTGFTQIKAKDVVNLELPVTIQTLLSGHIVQGHVDARGEIAQIESQENSKILTIKIKKELNKFIVEKGSIAVNGISLTVISTGKDFFTVGIIPYTWKHTMLKQVKIGDLVNIETDILAKYLEKIIRKEENK